VPAFARDPELVGIYGGDLDHVMDAVGAPSHDARARTLRDEVTRRNLAEAAAHPPARPEAVDSEGEEAQDERMAGYYAGDLRSVLENRKKS
jgi:ribosomal protein L12E/L44/L45/RPP1/RPP2